MAARVRCRRARINYTITVQATGSGSAANTVFSDNIPANTTYVPGTLRLNSALLSDAAADDAGEFMQHTGRTRARDARHSHPGERDSNDPVRRNHQLTGEVDVKETHMIKGNRKVLGIFALMACAFGSQAFAQTQGCIVLKSTAEVEKEVVNDKGEKSRSPGAGRQGHPGNGSRLDRDG